MRTITPYNNNGSIGLAFSYAGKRYRFNPVPQGSFDDKLAFSKACEIALKIQQDCTTGNFDPTLVKYKPQSNVAVVHSELVLTEDNPKLNTVNLLKLFDEFLAAKKDSLAENTIVVGYSMTRNKIVRCPHKRVNEAQKIIQWMITSCKGKGKSSARKALGIISACCKWGVSVEKLQSNPFEKASEILRSSGIVAKDEEPFPFEPVERDAIIDAFKAHKTRSHYAPLVEFLFFTGCRPSEALALQWKHIKDKEVIFCQKVTSKKNIEAGTKTQERRKVPLNQRVLDTLASIRKSSALPNDYVFVDSRGGLIRWSSFSSDIWRKMFKNLPDIEYRSAYHTRHTAITQMLRNGMDSVTVARLVGNSPNIIAKHYAGDLSGVEMKSV